MQIQKVPIDSVYLDPANVRKHDKDNLKAIKASLKRFGQQKPIVIDKDDIVRAGNGTLTAAKELGWTEIAVVRSDLAAVDLAAYAIADNRTAELAEWDMVGLEAQLKEFDEELRNIAFEDFKFTEEPKEGLTDPDEMPENVETRCKPGDLWLLGNHRLLCGDSTDVLQVERLMGGEKADMVFTDPPYGMNLDTDYSKMLSKNKFRKVEGDDRQFDPQLLLQLFANCREVFLFGADYYVEMIKRKYPDLGSWIVWDKRSKGDQIGVLDGSFGSDFELCWSREKHKREIARVIRNKGAFLKLDDVGTVHPTMKPVELVEWFFERWGKPNDLVIDIFLGSGSTLIACEKTGRKCYGMEIDPKYCDVILSRWEKFTGKTAVLA